jgi:hypothetical protein
MSFKTKAINAQGSVLAIDNGEGSDIAVTAITKANPAVVSSTATVEVGDVVRFGAITGMHEIEGLIGVVTKTTTGTSFEVNIDATNFAAAGTTGNASNLTFVSGCEVKSFNGFDGQAAEVDVTTLCSVAREYLPGLQDFGSFNFDLNLVPNDPFQVELNDAKAGLEKRAFKLTLPEGEDGKQFAYIFDAFVRQFTISGGVDQAIAGSVVLRVTGAPTLVELTPAP